MNQVLRNLVSAILLVVALSSFVSRLSSQLQPFSSEQLLFLVHAKGDQIYVCQEDAGKFAWVLKAPDAKLFNKDGKLFGKHLAGPTWEASDGSRVAGKVAASVDCNDPRFIPWLLVDVVSHERSGVLSHVATIHCLYTRGGVAPIFVCNSSHVSRKVRVLIRRLAFLRAEIVNASHQ
jgi:hypothetical protein